MSAKQKIAITTTFAQYDRRPIEKVGKGEFGLCAQPLSRKLTKEDFLNLIGDSVGVIAGTEDLDAQVIFP